MKWHFLTVVLAAILSSPVQAKTIYVNANANYATQTGVSWHTAFVSIQGGINAAVSGDEVWVAAAEYNETTSLKAGVWVYGGFAGTETASGQRDWTTNIAYLHNYDGGIPAVTSSGADAVLDGFRVYSHADGIVVLDGSLTVSNCSVGTLNATGIDVYSGTATVINCTMSGNVYGVYSRGTATVTGCTLSGNLYTGVVAYGNGTATVAGCTMSGNGGGVAVGYGGTATVTDCAISGNGGVGVFSYGGTATVTVTGSTISDNYSAYDGSGGGVGACYGGTATVTNCTISGNSSGVYVYYATFEGYPDSFGGTATVTDCTIRGNTAGVYSQGGTTNVSNCTISGNTSGVWVEPYGTATVSNCTISGNSKGVYSNGKATRVTNCTLTKNPYGVYILSGGTATATNCIMGFNGTGLYRQSSSDAVTLSHNDVYGSTSANYFNIGDPTGTFGNISQDPKLSNVYHDIHIQPGSPCIDAGDDSVVKPGWTDMDGQPRIQGAHVDIGSDESDELTWSVPSRTWFVTSTGNDASDGLSWATSKKTVGGAFATAQGADEVWVARGVYYENVIIPMGVALYGGFAGTESATGQRDLKANFTVLDGSANGRSVVTALYEGALLDGIVARNGTNGVYVVGCAVPISNCAVSGNSKQGIYVLNHGAVTISNCAVTGSSDTGVAVGSDGASVTNCTISGNNCGFYVLSGAAATAKNCIVAFNGTGIDRQSSSGAAALSHSDVYGNATANYADMSDQTGTNGNISQDPLFANLATKDYHLVTGSPCIDSGDDTAVKPGETDLDGKPRIIGAHVDVGAYEAGAARIPFAMSDALRALQLAGGLLPCSADNLTRLNLEQTGSSAGVIDMLDAILIARKVAGLEANP